MGPAILDTLEGLDVTLFELDIDGAVLCLLWVNKVGVIQQDAQIGRDVRVQNEEQNGLHFQRKVRNFHHDVPLMLRFRRSRCWCVVVLLRGPVERVPLHRQDATQLRGIQ